MKRLFTSFFILFTASGLWAQGPYDYNYDGSTITIPDNKEYQRFTSDINVTDSGTLADLDIMITMDSGNADYLGFGLISPDNTAFLFKSSTVGTSGSYYETIFDDEASTSITSGSPPYTGRYKIPTNAEHDNLSIVDGESITGTWKLVVYTRSNLSASIDWSLLMTTNSNTPIDNEVKYDGTYNGNTITIPDNKEYHTFTSDINVTDSGTLADLDIKLNMDSGNADYLGFAILSPDGTAILFKSVTVGTSGSYYETIFDDEGPRETNQGSPPYMGRYKPPVAIASEHDSLSIVDGESITGTWKLVVYTRSNLSASIDWSLLMTTNSNTPIDNEVKYDGTYNGNTITIPNNQEGKTFTDEIDISTIGKIVDLDIKLNMDNGNVDYLGFSLKAPSGITYTLKSSTSGTSGAYYQTIFDDEANRFLFNGSPPYMGRFYLKDDNKLSRLDGQSITGKWKMIIYTRSNLSASIDWTLLFNYDNTAPSAPTNLVVAESGDTSVKLKWSQNSESDVSKYYIYKGTSTNPTTLIDSTNSKSDTTKLVTGLTTETKYYFRVKAVDHVWNISDYSNEVSVTPTHNPKIYVSKDGNDTGSYGLESAPFKTIAAAIIYSGEGDTIIVNEGTYSENLTLNKNVILTSNYYLDSDTSHISKTIIDGNKTGRVLKIAKDDNTAGIDTTAKIIGLTIQGGQINEFGQGIYINNSSPIIRKNIIQHNKSAPTQNVDCSGGGIMVGGSSNPIIEYNVIRFNEAFPSGGGIMVWLAGDETIIRRNQIYKNAVVDANNFGAYTQHGGGIRMHMGSLINNTIWDNLSDSVPNDLLMDKKQYLRNNIIGKIYHPEKDESEIRYNLSLDKLGGVDNIQDFPLFLDSLNNNYNLTFYSPARDAGDPNSPKDPDGTRADIGALYFDNRDNQPPTVAFTSNALNDKYKLGTKQNITWSTTDNFPTDTIKIKLEYSTNFSSGVWTKIADSLSNTGTYEWSVPNIPSSNGGIKVTATDFGGNTDADSSEKIFEIYYPSVTLQSLSNTTLKISEQVSIKWSTASEPLVELVDLYYTVDDGTNWKDMSLNEENDGDYLWTVPNEPTITAGIRIIAKEQFGYKDTADVKGLKIEIEYPTVTSVNPNQDNIWWDIKEIKFKTNIIFDSQTVNNNSVILTNSQADYGYSVTQSNDTITVKFASTLITYDSISIKLDASKIKSPFGYGLDGNGDGTPGDDYTIIKKVYMPIDYDYSGTINASDVSLFVDYFKSNDSKWETAPIVAGTVPYVKILPDGKYDIDDMLTFVQFGNWYLQGASGKVADDIGNTPISLDTTIQSKDYTVSFSKSTKAIEVYVKYDPLKLTPIIEPTSGEIKLGHHDTEKGIISLIVYNPSDENIRLKWNQLDKKSESDISVLVKTTDQNGQETVKRTMLKVISVPSEFALHDNYPNPFNPTTTFRFDVPEVSDVTLSIYNMLGQRVRTFNYQNTSAGYHSVTWDATNDLGEQVGAGVYLYQLRANQFVKTRKMVLLK